MEPHIILDEESDVTDDETETDLELAAEIALLEAHLLELESQNVQKMIQIRRLQRRADLLRLSNYALMIKQYHMEQLHMLQVELYNQLRLKLMMLEQIHEALVALDQPVPPVPALAIADSHTAAIRNLDQDLAEQHRAIDDPTHSSSGTSDAIRVSSQHDNPVPEGPDEDRRVRVEGHDAAAMEELEAAQNVDDDEGENSIPHAALGSGFDSDVDFSDEDLLDD